MNLIVKKVQKFWEYGAGRTALAAFCAHSVSISIGICQGYSAILIPQLNASVNISAEESSWLASFGAVTNPIGSIISGFCAEYFGRKRSMQISMLPFLIGWLCIAWATNIRWLYAGRLISGIAAGMSSACYTYVSEISSPETRGLFQSLGPICASFGILFTYILGYLTTWSRTALFSTLFALFTFASIQLLPETPPYLLKSGKIDECFRSHLWLGKNNAQAQAEIAKYQAINAETEPITTKTHPFMKPETIKPFFILVVLFLLQNLAGIYTILFYAVSFFAESGLELDNYIASIIVGAIRFAMALFGAFLINRVGRRTLCIVSSAGMTLTLLPLLTIYYMKRMGGLVCLVCILLNVLFSMVGMLPVPWILVGELFPLSVRSIMSGLVICIAQCCVFICVKMYPDLVAWAGFGGALASFCAASLVSLIFCLVFMPETKNKSLEEIEESFRGGKNVKGCINEGFQA